MPVVAHRAGRTWKAWFQGKLYTGASASELRRVLIGAGAAPSWVKAALGAAGAGRKASASPPTKSKSKPKPPKRGKRGVK